MIYTVVKNVTLNGGIVEAGAVVDIQDTAMAEKLLAKGTIVAEGDAVTEQAEVTADPTPLVEAPLEVQNQQVQPTPEQITEDLTSLEAPSVVQPTDLNIQ